MEKMMKMLMIGCGLLLILSSCQRIKDRFMKEEVRTYEETPEARQKVNEERARKASEQETANDYSPAKAAIRLGSDGGQWEQMQSGEVAYVYPESGQYGRSIWVEDEDGTIYYVDTSGCRMRKNQAPDGYFTDDTGAWDASRQPVTERLDPQLLSKHFTDTPEGLSLEGWVFQNITADGSGTAGQTFGGGIAATYNCQQTGINTFTLVQVDDTEQRCHVVLLDNGRRIRLSWAGDTRDFYGQE